MILGLVIVFVTALAPRDSNACITHSLAEALTDMNLPATSGAYDPCDNWLRWIYTFNRYNAANGTRLQFEVLGAPGSYREYLDSDYGIGGPYKNTGTVYVGPSTYNEVTISRTGQGGTFLIITAHAYYYNSQPTGPDEE
jgi:hypothetical protein